MYKRKCPICEKVVLHTQRSNCWTANNKKSPCRKCSCKNRDISGCKNPFYGKHHTEKTKSKIRNMDRSFAKTPEFRKKMAKLALKSSKERNGRCNYDFWLEKYGKKEADAKLEAFKIKLSTRMRGKGNPMYGKPAPHGSGYGWKGWYAGWFFRSLRELSYVVLVIEKQGLKWQSAERQQLRIPYTNWQGRERTYVADFLVEENQLIEIKPYKLQSSKDVVSKTKSAKKFCKKRGWTYKVVDPPVLSHVEIRNLRSKGLLVFTKNYEKLYKDKYCA